MFKFEYFARTFTIIINAKENFFNCFCSEKTNSSKKTRRTSKEMYKEAAEFLGITCTLTDDCRCLDCQVIAFFQIN